MITVINASAAVTLLEQRPEKFFFSKIFSGLCVSSVTAALALITVITQLLLWDKLLSLKEVFEESKNREALRLIANPAYLNHS